jgi:hypothetical protein
MVYLKSITINSWYKRYVCKHAFFPFIFSVSKVDYASDYGNKNSTPAGGRIA